MNFGNGLLLLLVVAGLVAMISRRLRLPYSIVLVAAGIVLAFLPVPRIEFTRELIFDALLPPLIFEASFFLEWKRLRRELPIVLTFATVGVALSCAVAAVAMHYLAGWDWPSALVFGSLIAATDPVSVIATFRDAGVSGRLRLLVESESLINDGTAAVAFGAAVLAYGGQEVTAGWLSMQLLMVAIGSAIIGALVGGVMLFLTGRTDDHLVELTFTTVAAYASFVIAERFHFSGVLATIVAGLMIGNLGRGRVFSERGSEALEAFWEYLAFIANSLVFLLIGIEEATQSFASSWPACVAGVGAVLAGRAVAVYPLAALFYRSSLRVSAGQQHVLFWGGLRGALALALALGLPAGMAQRSSILTVSFAVVAFSIFVQGLSMRPLLRAVDELPGGGQA